MKVCGVYLIRHIETGMCYVGQSVDVTARLLQHASGKCKMRLGRAIAKHGWNAFESQVLEACERNRLNAVESDWIARLGCISPAGFNLTTGGGQAFAWSAESLARKSRASKSRSVESFEKSASFHRGRKRSEETCKKVGEANRRRVITEETRRRLSEAHAKVSPETRQRLADAAKAHWVKRRAAKLANGNSSQKAAG